ncbi:hypothetical protein MTP99_003401 [Tenebrio molitor]|nr:hypothetical protein MTP99_003401 [Tenebrio molitor]
MKCRRSRRFASRPSRDGATPNSDVIASGGRSPDHCREFEFLFVSGRSRCLDLCLLTASRTLPSNSSFAKRCGYRRNTIATNYTK